MRVASRLSFFFFYFFFFLSTGLSGRSQFNSVQLAAAWSKRAWPNVTKFMAIGIVVFDVEQISSPGRDADPPISRFVRANRIECVDCQICRLLFLFVAMMLHIQCSLFRKSTYTRQKIDELIAEHFKFDWDLRKFVASF